MLKENKFAFLDTPIFLHFQFFTEIDWNKVLQTKFTTLIIAPITPKELDKHKYNHTSEKIRERATKVTKKLVELIRLKSQVRNNVNIQFERIEPQSEFETYNLSKDSQDDHLIASLLRFQKETGNKAILITDDSGLILKAPLLDIEIVELPEIYRIKPEKDKDKKEIERLRNELAILKIKTPKLKLISLDNEKNISCQTLSEVKIFDKTFESELIEIKNEFHQITETTILVKRDDTKKEVPFKLKGGGKILGNIQTDTVEFKLHSGEIKRSYQEYVDIYNQKLKEFYVEYEKYLKEKYRINHLRNRTVIFQVKLENEGTTPATGVNVILNFPTNFSATTNEEIFSYPQEIKPPKFIDYSLISNSQLSILDNLQYFSSPSPPKLPSYYWKKVTIERKDFLYTA